MSQHGRISTGRWNGKFQCISVEWKIREFFSLSREVVHSPCFHFLDGTWYLIMYPNGAVVRPREYVELYINRQTSYSGNHYIRFRLEMRTKNGIKLRSFGIEMNFNIDGATWGSNKFIARSELLRRTAEFNQGGVVIISCDLCAQVAETIEVASQTESHEGGDNLSENSKKLFLSGEGNDLTLNVRGREFQCHRAILAARSSVFATMLTRDMLGRTVGVVQIKDCEPEAFQEFLMYLYSGSVENFTEGNAFGLYRIADKYDAPEVKVRCVHLLTDGLCVENFCDVVDLALQH